MTDFNEDAINNAYVAIMGDDFHSEIIFEECRKYVLEAIVKGKYKTVKEVLYGALFRHVTEEDALARLVARVIDASLCDKPAAIGDLLCEGLKSMHEKAVALDKLCDALEIGERSPVTDYSMEEVLKTINDHPK